VNHALALQDLHFGYGRQATVRGVSLHLDKGDCYGFLGHNGAGKTTIMRLCLGLIRPSSGSIRIFGIDPATERRRANSLLGALIERTGFHLHASARKNLASLARLQGISPKLANAEVSRVIECVGLNHAADQRVGTFSMGMRQRLGVAQALLGKPRLLLLDEPTNGLDPEGIADLRKLLHRLRQDEGTAIMLSSHQLAELEGLCNKVGVLREGKMVTEGNLTDLRQRVGARHVITGEPINLLEEELQQMELPSTRDGDRLLVELSNKKPHEVTRILASKARLNSFAPEQATLERIYLHADKASVPVDSSSPEPTQANELKTVTPPKPALGSTNKPRMRSFAFEASILCNRRSTLPLLLIPCAAATFAVANYSSRVADGLKTVEAGERFSADAGSGFQAVAQSLQAATPVLALSLMWLGSQTIASDFTADTLRNSIIRSVRRRDVLFGKVFVLLAAMIIGWTALLATSIGVSWATVGFGNLEEVTRFGDRELLAASADVWPTMWITLLEMTLPLGAIVMLSAAASSIAKRPALALATAALFISLPEVFRGVLGDRSGWLLTSHLPIAFRDESALSYLAGVARGAADATWIWADQAAYAPISWMIAGSLVLGIVVNRMRVP
jgi:ABC-type multidrug transport system ATPase subunit